VTTSGRGEQFDGAESMVGLLINTTPARVRVDPDERVATWLRRLQKEQVEARAFEHTPLVQIQAWSDVPAGQPLFNYLFIFENYPDGRLEEGKAGSAVSGLSLDENFSREQGNYPLTVFAGPGPELSIGLAYDRARFDDSTVEQMAGQLTALLHAIAEDPGQRVGELPLTTETERRRLLVTWNETATPVFAVGGVH
jgi:non-ribosomal peptide synthetase component F